MIVTVDAAPRGSEGLNTSGAGVPWNHVEDNAIFLAAVREIFLRIVDEVIRANATQYAFLNAAVNGGDFRPIDLAICTACALMLPPAPLIST